MVDNGFDVVGFNEVKSGTQQTELKELLPQYAFHGWDGHEGWEDSGETAVDLVAWRPEKFDMLDKGWFFLSRDQEVWEPSWDNSSMANVRHTSWVKLKGERNRRGVLFLLHTSRPPGEHCPYAPVAYKL